MALDGFEVHKRIHVMLTRLCHVWPSAVVELWIHSLRLEDWWIMMLCQYVCAPSSYACLLGALTHSNECSHVCSDNLILIYLIFAGNTQEHPHCYLHELFDISLLPGMWQAYFSLSGEINILLKRKKETQVADEQRKFLLWLEMQ